MAEIIHQVTATIAAGATKTSPSVTSISLPPEDILSIDLEVPPGPGGLMGFYLAVSGQQMIPFEAGQWLVWDDRVASWPVDNYPTNAKWSIVGYNEGNFDHEVVIRFHSNSAVQTSPQSILPSVTVVNGNSDALSDVAL